MNYSVKLYEQHRTCSSDAIAKNSLILMNAIAEPTIDINTMMFTRKKYKTITLGILMACLTILLFGCAGGTDDPGISQEGLSINLISPSRGIPGDTVAIHGVNFSSEAVVTFRHLDRWRAGRACCIGSLSGPW